MYLQTISTIHARNRDDFSCLVSLKFSNYMLHANGNYLDGEVPFQLEKFLVPDGNYSKSELLDYLNRKLYYFGIVFEETVGKRCLVKFEKHFEFFSGSKILSRGKTISSYSSSFVKKSTSKTANGYDRYGLFDKLDFGPGLGHILGFEKNVVTFEVKPGNTKTDYFGIVESKYLMDDSDGLNFIFVDCDKVEPVQLGFTYRSNLLVCPIGVGGMGTVSYSPSGYKQKLKSGIIDRIHVTVNDINENRIFFNNFFFFFFFRAGNWNHTGVTVV